MNINSKRKEQKNKVYMGLAEKISELSTCITRKVGAVIIKNDKILSIGFNGSVRNAPHCNETYCIKNKFRKISTSKYLTGDICRALHAEQNAILFANKNELENAIMYVTLEPCETCLKMIINSGIKEVYFKEKYKPNRTIFTKEEIQVIKIIRKELKSSLKKYEKI